jgi:hypothetical protein
MKELDFASCFMVFIFPSRWIWSSCVVFSVEPPILVWLIFFWFSRCRSWLLILFHRCRFSLAGFPLPRRAAAKSLIPGQLLSLAATKSGQSQSSLRETHLLVFTFCFFWPFHSTQIRCLFFQSRHQIYSLSSFCSQRSTLGILWFGRLAAFINLRDFCFALDSLPRLLPLGIFT